MSKDSISINVCGDFYLSPELPERDFFSSGILELFEGSDINIVNLEGPLTKHTGRKIIKTGPSLSISPRYLKYLKQLGINLVTLANNHIMDQGFPGLSDTLSLLRENSIKWVGAGMSIDDAVQPFCIEIKNIRIAVLNFTEHEWSVAERNKPGANPLDLPENVRQIKKVRETNDVVIVIIHGGNEHYNLPNPRMVSQYRFYAESGASVIIGHHPHCISGFEVFHGVPIFYSLGNFLFSERSDYKSWYSGLILNIKIKDTETVEWELIPIRQDEQTYVVTKPDADLKQVLIAEIEKYSKIICDQQLLTKYWEDFINENGRQFINIFNPVNMINNRHLRRALIKTGLSRFFMKKGHYVEMLNHIECESLADAVKYAMRNFLDANDTDTQ